MSLKDIINKAKQKAPEGTKIEIEVNTIAEAMEATTAGADIVFDCFGGCGFISC